MCLPPEEIVARQSSVKTPQLTDKFHGKMMGRAGGVAAVAALRCIRNMYLDPWTAGRVI